MPHAAKNTVAKKTSISSWKQEHTCGFIWITARYRNQLVLNKRGKSLLYFIIKGYPPCAAHWSTSYHTYTQQQIGFQYNNPYTVQCIASLRFYSTYYFRISNSSINISGNYGQILIMARCLGGGLACSYVNGLMELCCPLETAGFGLGSSALSSVAVETENTAP